MDGSKKISALKNLQAHAFGKNPEQVAGLVLRRLEAEALPINVDSILNRLGLEVSPSSAFDVKEKRFEQARYLGRQLLDLSGVGRGGLERGIERFAVNLLVPLNLLENLVERGVKGSRLSYFFNVSEEIITERLRQLNGEPVS